jgi:hypothetical protein
MKWLVLGIVLIALLAFPLHSTPAQDAPEGSLDWDDLNALANDWRTKGAEYVTAFEAFVVAQANAPAPEEVFERFKVEFLEENPPVRNGQTITYVVQGIAFGAENGDLVMDVSQAFQEYYLAHARVPRAPLDPRGDLAERVLEIVRQANAAGEVARLRAAFPPAVEPYLERINSSGGEVSQIAFLTPQAIVARVSWSEEGVYLLEGVAATKLLDVVGFGRSPNRQFWAKAYADRVEIHEGWDGDQVARLVYPKPRLAHGEVGQVIPANDGRSALLAVPTGGVFLLTGEEARRVHPAPERIALYRERGGWDDWGSLQGTHCAASPGGELVVVGDKDGAHRFLTWEGQPIAEVDPLRDYCVSAFFSQDGEHVALSARDYGDHAVRILPTSAFQGGPAGDGAVVQELLAPVDAAVSIGAQIVFGSRMGDLRGVDPSDGSTTWYYLCGGSISAMDVSADGKRVVVGSRAGMVHLIDLDTGTKNPQTITDSTHAEARRWLFWRGERQPLAW